MRLDATSKRFLHFCIVGAASTAFMYILLGLFVELGQLPPTIGSSLAYLLSSLLNYWLNHHVTFGARGGHKTTLPKFVAVASSGFMLNALIMYLGTSYTELHYLLVQIVATGCILAWNFTGLHRWAYTPTTRS